MFGGLNKLIPRNIINGADNKITKINAFMKNIDSGIGKIGEIESALLGTNNIVGMLQQPLNKLNILKNNAINGYGFIKSLLGLGGSVFLEKSNGTLAGIPVLVKSTSFSRSNTITDYTTYNRLSFSDNMYIENYTLNVELIVYGVQVIDYLKSLVKLGEQTIPISFNYEKLNETYSPVAISSISYSEDYKNQNVFEVSLTLKEVKLLSTVDKQETTNIFKDDEKVQTKELTKVSSTKKKPKKPTTKYIKVKDNVEMKKILSKHKGNKNLYFIYDNDFVFRPN